MKKILVPVSASLMSVLLLMGCASSNAVADSENMQVLEAKSSQSQPNAADATTENDIGAVTALLGQLDKDTENLFGGGEENWTADQSTYIGRIFQTDLSGKPVTIYTSCGADNKVNSVSIWFTDGSEQVTEEQITFWKDQIIQYTQVELEDRGISEESGTHTWRSQAQGNFYTLRLLGDILTLDINPAVGELK